MRHIVQYLHAHYETVLINSFGKIKYALVVNFNFVCVPQLLVFFFHQAFAFPSQLRRNFYQSIFAIAVHLQVIVFEEVQDRVSHSAGSWTDFKYFKGVNVSVFHLIDHKIGNSVAIKRFEKFTWRDPSIVWVQLLHTLSILVVPLQLIERYLLLKNPHLVLLPRKIATLLIQPIMHEVSEHDLLSK